MCTAYEIGNRAGSFPDHLKADAIAYLGNLGSPQIIRPTLEAPVILPDGSLEIMSWGFRRSFPAKAKDKPPVNRTIVNSRDDKLSGRMWGKAFRERRCLIPVATFFEWTERGGKKVPLAFERPNDEWTWIAGIWEQPEESLKHFSMITTPPNEVVAPVHDRMPAVLSEDKIGDYLGGEMTEMSPSTVHLKFSESPNFLKKKHQN